MSDQEESQKSFLSQICLLLSIDLCESEITLCINSPATVRRRQDGFAFTHSVLQRGGAHVYIALGLCALICVQRYLKAKSVPSLVAGLGSAAVLGTTVSDSQVDECGLVHGAQCTQ